MKRKDRNGVVQKRQTVSLEGSADETMNHPSDTATDGASDTDNQAKKANERLKRRKRRKRELISFLIRVILLAAVVYVLFFHVVGITMMPGKDMYPRLDAGDMLLFIFYPTRPYDSPVEYPLTLKDGEYFVLADQRNGSMDSRYFGVVNGDEIQGILITMLRRNNL